MRIARKDIRVNALAPTAATRMTEDLIDDEALAALTENAFEQTGRYVAMATGADVSAGVGR